MEMLAMWCETIS